MGLFKRTGAGVLALLALAAAGCTQESQNKIGRSIQNWTGTDGIIEIYAGDEARQALHERSTRSPPPPAPSNGASTGPYRFGYGVLDANLNGTVDKGEKKVYFEFSDYSTSYVFYENPA